jgi:hypothetical protein
VLPLEALVFFWSGCTVYSYLNGGVKGSIAARGAGEVRMNAGNKKTAQLLVLTLNRGIFALAEYSITTAKTIEELTDGTIRLTLFFWLPRNLSPIQSYG